MDIKKVRIIKKDDLDESKLNDIYNHLSYRNIEITNNINDADFMITFGGDGTILLAAQELIETNKPVIAVNMGSLGYLADIKLEETIYMIDKFLENNYKLENRYFLEVQLNEKNYYGLNELVLAKGGLKSHLINVEVYANEILINKYRADGVIISTPTGSTAYSLSSGGPIVHPQLFALSITPLSPQSLNARPIIIDGNEKLTFKISSRDNDVHFNIDGNIHFKIDENDKIIATLSTKAVHLIKSERIEYYGILREKLKWGDLY